MEAVKESKEHGKENTKQSSWFLGSERVDNGVCEYAPA
jgi:hypothetical protein